MKRILAAAAVFVLLFSGCGAKEPPESVVMLDYAGREAPAVEELTRYPNLEQLDLRDTGITAEAFDAYARALPECEILWSVPFQGQYLPSDTEELTVEALTEADAAMLCYFPQLKILDARNCPDPEIPARLGKEHPHWDVRYQVTVGGKTVDADVESLELDAGELQAAQAALGCLPRLRSVTVSGGEADREQVEALMDLCPDAEFHFKFSVCGVPTDSDAAELDLSGIPMESVAEVEESLHLFNGLEKVIMCDCGIPSEEMDALWKRHPETRFVWTVSVAKARIRTDTTALIFFTYGYSGDDTKHGDDIRDKDCGEMKYLVDLVCLDIGHMSIRDLSFLEYMPNMEYLLLCDNGIRDITPVGGLKKLKYLETFNNPISDLSALAGCTALEDLNFTYNTPKDVTFLKELPNLKNLWATGGLLTKDQVAWMEAEFADINLVLYSGRSTAAGWRELPNYYKQRDLLGMWYMTTP